MTALPEELREAVETLRHDTNLIRTAVGIALAEKNIPREPQWTQLTPASLDRIDAALAALTAYLSRQHELLREAEEAMDIAEGALARLWVTLPDHVAVRVNDALHECRSWLARYREQEEGL